MKLIFCPICGDLITLKRNEPRYCACGKSFGVYEGENNNATVGGDAIPIHFDNKSFLEAIRSWVINGTEQSFSASIIPKEASVLKWKTKSA